MFFPYEMCKKTPTCQNPKLPSKLNQLKTTLKQLPNGPQTIPKQSPNNPKIRPIFVLIVRCFFEFLKIRFLNGMLMVLDINGTP